MFFVAVFLVLVLASIAASRSRDALSKACVTLAWLAGIVAFMTSWVFRYRWAERSGCREAFPEHFGYRAPNYEQAPFPVDDRQSWWPLGRECTGRDSDTSTMIAEYTGWGLTMVVYPALICVVVALAVVPVRIARLGRRASSPRS
ncbi:hypothetical protein QMK32_09410 [Rhodococcus sp. H29-C3]|nr:hypothetical protein [Rhodococcus sp. H29-C3]